MGPELVPAVTIYTKLPSNDPLDPCCFTLEKIFKFFLPLIMVYITDIKYYVNILRNHKHQRLNVSHSSQSHSSPLEEYRPILLSETDVYVGQGEVIKGYFTIFYLIVKYVI